MINTPELDKMVKIQEKSQTIGEFLSFMESEKHYMLCKRSGEFNEFSPVRRLKEDLIAEFFNIDLKKVEQEKRSLLKEVQENEKQRTSNS